MGVVLGGDQAASVSFRAARLTGSVIRYAIRQYVSAKETSAGGRQITDRALNARGATENINLDSHKDLIALQKELHNYGVDYSVKYQPEAKTYEVWFLGKDIKRVKEGLARAVAQWDKDAGRTSIQERFAAAKETAAKRNAERNEARTQQAGKQIDNQIGGKLPHVADQTR